MARDSVNTLIFTLIGMYMFTVVYNIIYFHSSGLASQISGDLESVRDTYKIKFDDDLATKLHSQKISTDPRSEIVETKPESGESPKLDSEHSITNTQPKNAATMPKSSNTSKNESPDLDSDGSIINNYRHETNVFKKMLERSTNDADICRNLHPDHLGKPKEKDFDTGVPPLPENGIHEVLKAWLDGGYKDRGDYPMCELPPTLSCEVEKYSLILMSHTVSDNMRLGKLKNGIKDFAQRPETAEIILVWNSEKEVLLNSDKSDAKLIVEWNNDESHPLRIFFSLENGLGNNLLNRYHPMLQPKQEAIMYFDDDGPFYEPGPMHAGFSLWKFNSDVQIGSLTRNIRFPSERMNDLQNKATSLAAEHYRKNSWQTHTHPYDTDIVNRAMAEAGESEPGYPNFTPICRDETGDNVEYNYFVFPNYKAHMSLPSGSFLHRNYLCFVWHPLFKELRQFILDHPTHPDDMTISTLVSHLTGKPIRTFPRYFRDQKRRLEEEDMEIEEKHVEDDTSEINVSNIENMRRRLLWQQKDWGNMREEAINSILGYFGSINPGSVGWCAGTEYEKPDTGKGNMVYKCDPEYPSGADMIPWLKEGGLGYDECPDPNL